MRSGFILTILILASMTTVEAQQIAVMKRGNIMARYNLGDPIRFELKDQDQVFNAAIIAIHEFDFVTVGKDTIAFSRVSRLRFKSPSRRKASYATMAAGASLGLLSLALDKPFGDKNPQSVRGLRYVGIYGTGFGLFMLVTSKSSIRIKGYKRLRYIPYDSPLYQ